MNHQLIWNFEFHESDQTMLDNLTSYPKETLKWEIRFFWPDDQQIVLNNLNDALLNLTNYQHKQRSDSYYLVPDHNLNIKKRQGNLVYKPLIEQRGNALGFSDKIPLQNSCDTHLSQLLEHILAKGTIIEIHKEAYQFKFPTHPKIKLELARLEVLDKTYFSACVEGHSLNLVKILTEHLLPKHLSCDYVHFLKNIIKL